MKFYFFIKRRVKVFPAYVTIDEIEYPGPAEVLIRYYFTQKRKVMP